VGVHKLEIMYEIVVLGLDLGRCSLQVVVKGHNGSRSCFGVTPLICFPLYKLVKSMSAGP
jgi:hypothetical protein